MPAVSAAARKTTLVTSDTTGQACIEAGVGTGIGGSSLSEATASPAGSTFARESKASTGCVGEADIPP
eukprot:4230542-Pleurochrysis_carterae.AAC.2